MRLDVQKRLAAKILNCSPKKIRFDTERLSEIKEAITKFDINTLIRKGAIIRLQSKGVSRIRARKRQLQRSKGKRSGYGRRKGKATARQPKKMAWVNLIRLQRKFLRTLKDKGMIDTKTYSSLYRKAKGGFFRSKQHLKIYMEERGMLKKGKK